MIGSRVSRTIRGAMAAMACAVLTVAGCSRTPTEKTRTYHREECPPVHMAKGEEMTPAEARARNFRPCPTCKPDSV